MGLPDCMHCGFFSTCILYKWKTCPREEVDDENRGRDPKEAGAGNSGNGDTRAHWRSRRKFSFGFLGEVRRRRL